MGLADIARRYLEIFCSGQNFDELYEIFDENLLFEGPFLNAHSAQEYIEALRRDPPRGCAFTLLHSFQSGRFVNLIYEFRKPGLRTTMSQLFEFRRNKIIHVVLIFDTFAFRGQKRS